MLTVFLQNKGHDQTLYEYKGPCAVVQVDRHSGDRSVKAGYESEEYREFLTLNFW